MTPAVKPASLGFRHVRLPAPRRGDGSRVWSALPDGTREALDGLSPSDLQTLLADVMSRRASRVTAGRGATPVGVGPAGVALGVRPARARARSKPASGSASPASSTASSCRRSPRSGPARRWPASARTASSRPRAAARWSATRRPPWRSRRRAGGEPRPPRRRCTSRPCHRQLRTQPMGGASAHFRLLTLVSSARDRGSGATEADLLVRHLRTWRDVLAEAVPGLRHDDRDLGVEPGAGRPGRRPGPTGLGDRPRWRSSTRPSGPGPRGTTPTWRSASRCPDRTGRSRSGTAGSPAGPRRSTENRKERCLVSCVSTERLLALAVR